LCSPCFALIDAAGVVAVVAFAVGAVVVVAAEGKGCKSFMMVLLLLRDEGQ